MVDVNLESEEGAQEKADQAQSDAESFAASEVESHRSTETHDTAQPPQSHDNEAHDRDFVDEGEAAAAAPVQSVNGQQGDVEVGVIPEGVITIWSGDESDIPTGWTLCDGSDGAPDLTDRFVVAAGGQYAAGETGGENEVQLTESELPSHSHSGTTSTDGEHTHDVDAYTNEPGDSFLSVRNDTRQETTITDPAGEHSHELNTDPVGGDEAHENRPPYFALAFIMKL